MKKTNKKNSTARKLLPAFAMLTVSAISLSSATYAWFSMNKDVTVNGMNVNVKSDSTFLLVKSGTADADTIQASKFITDSAVNTNATLYPAAHDDITPASTGITAIEAADSETSTVKDIWYYRYNRDPGNSKNDMTAITYIPNDSFGQYVLVNEFSLTVADGSNALSNLRVKSCTITPGNKPGSDPAVAGDQAVKVLVAGANGCEEFSGTGVADRDNGTVIQTANVTSAAASTVKVYIYWDGNDDDVYTNGIEDLVGTSVQVVFTGDIVPAGA